MAVGAARAGAAPSPAAASRTTRRFPAATGYFDHCVSNTFATVADTGSSGRAQRISLGITGIRVCSSCGTGAEAGLNCR